MRRLLLALVVLLGLLACGPAPSEDDGGSGGSAGSGPTLCADDADCGPGGHCADFVCSGGSGGSGGIGAGGSGGGGAGCVGACAKLAGCFAETPELLSPTCVEDCDTALAGPDAEITRACLDCLDRTSCAAAFPPDGSESACAVDCTGGGPGCGPGEGEGADGLCHQTCAAVADCYDFAAFCASDALCYGVDTFAQCPQAAGLPGAAPGAPLIFDPRQDTIGTRGELCVKDPATCPNNGNVCQFSFQFYDPDGDVASSHAALYSRIRVATAGGALINAYDVLAAQGSPSGSSAASARRTPPRRSRWCCSTRRATSRTRSASRAARRSRELCNGGLRAISSRHRITGGA